MSVYIIINMHSAYDTHRFIPFIILLCLIVHIEQCKKIFINDIKDQPVENQRFGVVPFFMFLSPVVNFFLVEAETRRRWDIFQAEVTLYWELAVRRCSHPSLTFAQHSRVYTFQGGGIHRGGDNLNKACKCSTGISPLPEFPQPWPHQHNSVMQMHRC